MSGPPSTDISRRVLIRILLSVYLVALMVLPALAKQPNVLFILVDDLSWADLGCYGSKAYRSPAIDRFATQGMRFTDFYSGGPVCSPTRASILTGKSPARVRITRHLLYPKADPPIMVDHLPLDEVTIGEAFREAGYATGYFGKWHLGYEAKHWAGEQGFEVAMGGMDLAWAWKLCHPGRPMPPLDRVKDKHTRFFSPHHLTWLENGPEGEYLTDRLTNETIVVFTSDNGGKGSVTSNLPLAGAKHDLREGGIRVPTIIRWPGRVKADSECGVPLISHDFYPTLLEMCGLAPKPGQHLDGRSFAGVLRGEDAGALARRPLCWHYPHSRMEGAVRVGDHKLSVFYKTGEMRLHNLRKDIGESRDLSEDEPKRVDEMRAMFAKWLRKSDARFPEGLGWGPFSVPATR